MATQLSGLDGHHFSLRSILKNPSTSYDAESAGLQSISLTGEMNLQPAALSWSLSLWAQQESRPCNVIPIVSSTNLMYF